MWKAQLLSQISRGMWMINPQDALALGPIIFDILQHNNSFGEPRKPYHMQLPDAGAFMAVSDMDAQFEAIPKGSIAVFNISGTMLKQGTMCSYGTEEIANYVLSAGLHKNIGGIVLSMHSGGGAADSVAPLLSAIEKIKLTNKPVIASCDLCASAAYFVACACTEIHASNNICSQFGSIGVMMTLRDAVPVMEKEGYVFHKIYAPESDYKNLPFELALEGKYDMIKDEQLSPLAKRFQQEVKTNRKNLDLSVPGIINGKLFYAPDAKQNGLIDEIGDLSFSINRAKELSKKMSGNKLVSEYLQSK